MLQNRNQSYRETHVLVTVVLLTALVTEIIGELTHRASYNNSLFYNLLFVYLETCFFLYFFYLISDNQKTKRRLIFFSFGFVILGIVTSIFFQPLQLEFHNYSYAVGSLALITLAINFFLDVFNLTRYEDKNLLSIPYFWIVTVILFFYSTSFFYFTPVRLLYHLELSIIAPLGVINRLMAGLMYVVLGVAFYVPYFFKGKY